MWEFSLACSNKNKFIIDYINNCFCADLPDCMLTKYTDKHFTYLLFASDESIKSICENKIKKCVSTYIVDVYKYEYFVSKILKNRSLISEAYIKALSLYDVETDIALIMSAMEFGEQLYIDSFIKFKLGEIKRMWQELCELIISNINYLNRDMMIDVMRQFIATFDTPSITLKVIAKEDGFIMYRQENNKAIKLKDKAPAIEVVNYALLANPKCINIYGIDGQDFSITSLLKSLYGDKVNILN